MNKPDPVTTNLWFSKVVGVGWHYYPAGSPTALCGIGWGGFWDVREAKPDNNCCPNCVQILESNTSKVGTARE